MTNEALRTIEPVRQRAPGRELEPMIGVRRVHSRATDFDHFESRRRLEHAMPDSGGCITSPGTEQERFALVFIDEPDQPERQ